MIATQSNATPPARHSARYKTPASLAEETENGAQQSKSRYKQIRTIIRGGRSAGQEKKAPARADASPKRRLPLKGVYNAYRFLAAAFLAGAFFAAAFLAGAFLAGFFAAGISQSPPLVGATALNRSQLYSRNCHTCNTCPRAS